MLKNTLWGGCGIAIPLLVLMSLHRALQWPPAFPFSTLAVWLGGFIVLILLTRLMDAIFRRVFARNPAMERFGTGILIGCWIFCGVFLHS